MRYFIKFSYNGTHYHGWQKQPNAISVQETLNKALSTILNTTIDVMGAGRTDTGVHANQMFAHFDTETEINVSTIIHKLNSYLPIDIAIFNIIKVLMMHMPVLMPNPAPTSIISHTKKDVFQDALSWNLQQKLDIEKMNEASKLLLKHTDFQCFSKVNTEVNTFNCKIFDAHWQQNQNQLVFTIKADRFLRNMVRAIVGTMINIGLEKVSLHNLFQ